MTTTTEPPKVSGDDGGTGHLEELRTDPIGLMERVRAECGDVGEFRLADKDVVLLTGAEANEVFFRATDFGMATHLLSAMFTPTAGTLVPDLPLVLLALSLAALWAMKGPNAFELKHEWRWPGRIALATAFGAALALIVGNRPSPFLYFQF